MRANGKSCRTIWVDEKDNTTIRIIDQRELPHHFVIEDLKTAEDVFTAIKDMHVRGAPLIGVTAAYGMYLACLESCDELNIKKSADKLKSARPTAIDLSWAANLMQKEITSHKGEDKTAFALKLANEICEKSVEQCRRIGVNGLKIIEEIYKKKNAAVNILTHCNAGWLATVDYGTATSPIYAAHKKNIPIHVWVDETRPRNQGFLTAWELGEEGVPHTVIADNTGGHLMQNGMVDMVIVGCDRLTMNGDVTNKIGTYLKALAAFDNNIPFYVALPSSTIDWRMEKGSDVPIEKRGDEEMHFVTGIDENGKSAKIRIIPANSNAANYSFDVTPARFITGIITEKGIFRTDEISSLKKEDRIEEGYIKFSLDWKKEKLDYDISEMNEYRNKLYSLGLIGCYPNGIGYGNISKRVTGTNEFIISGTETGQFEKIDERHYTKVVDYEFKKNHVSCIGPIKASSESMTHAAIYESLPEISSVIHVHNKKLWDFLKGKVSETAEAVRYGTPEMALGVMELLKDKDATDNNIFIMLGHVEGIVTFGRDLKEAMDTLLMYYRKSKQN